MIEINELKGQANSSEKKVEFYIKMQKKMIDLRRQSNVYLNHAPHFEKYGLCQRIRPQHANVELSPSTQSYVGRSGSGRDSHALSSIAVRSCPCSYFDV